MDLALYRKYRPDKFEEVIGQEQSVLPLQRALASGRFAHAYLFSGPRGCGKTTSARIFARCLNCTGSDKPAATPCGKCASCKELSALGKGSVDVIEIDAASHRGIDDARELRDRINFAPVRDRFKVIILDEAHMITPDAFNALLKVIEEPPEHVKFIFATTEPQKVLDTIRSRTFHYPFKLVDPKTMEKFLNGICKKEKIAPEDGVVNLITRAGNGSVRDCLSLLDKILAASENGKVEFSLAQNILGFLPADELTKLADAILQAKIPELLKALDTIQQANTDPQNFLQDLLAFFRDLIASKSEAKIAKNLNYSEKECEQIEGIAASNSIERLIGIAEKLNEAANIQSSLNSKLFLEATLLGVTMRGGSDEILRFAPLTQEAELRSALDPAISQRETQDDFKITPPRNTQDDFKGVREAGADAAQDRSADSKFLDPAISQRETQDDFKITPPRNTKDDGLPRAEGARNDGDEADTGLRRAQGARNDGDALEGGQKDGVAVAEDLLRKFVRAWPKLVDAVTATDMKVGAILSGHSKPVEVTNETVILEFNDDAKLHEFLDNDCGAIVEQTIKQKWDQTITVMTQITKTLPKLITEDSADQKPLVHSVFPNSKEL